eukprot:3825450-Amphidinium_carterae.1
MDELGFAYHEEEEASQMLPFVGVELDLARRRLRNTPKRVWRLYGALEYLISRRFSSGAQMQIVAGHLVHLFMVRPIAMASMRHIYTFITRAGDQFLRMPPELLSELATIKGSLFIGSWVDLGIGFSKVVLCGDASSRGYALSVMQSDGATVKHECAYRE